MKHRFLGTLTLVVTGCFWLFLPSGAMLHVEAVEERPLTTQTISPPLFPIPSETTLRDGGFEAGTPSAVWDEMSVNYDTPICHRETCGDYARSGNYYVWFGGIRDTYEAASITQSFQIDPAEPVLHGYLKITSDNGSGVFQIALDGNPIARFTQDDAAAYHTYTPLFIDLSSHSVSMNHELTFSAVTVAGGLINFFLDDWDTRPADPTAVTLLSLTSSTSSNEENRHLSQVFGTFLALISLTYTLRRGVQ